MKSGNLKPETGKNPPLAKVVSGLAAARIQLEQQSANGDCMEWDRPRISFAQRECLEILSALNRWQSLEIAAELQSRGELAEPVEEAVRRFGGAA